METFAQVVCVPQISPDKIEEKMVKKTGALIVDWSSSSSIVWITDFMLYIPLLVKCKINQFRTIKKNL